MYFRSEATCEAIDMKIRQIKPIFTRETSALSLILKVRVLEFGNCQLAIVRVHVRFGRCYLELHYGPD